MCLRCSLCLTLPFCLGSSCGPSFADLVRKRAQAFPGQLQEGPELGQGRGRQVCVPRGGTQFKRGATHYIEWVQEVSWKTMHRTRNTYSTYKINNSTEQY